MKQIIVIIISIIVLDGDNKESMRITTNHLIWE